MQALDNGLYFTIECVHDSIITGSTELSNYPFLHFSLVCLFYLLKSLDQVTNIIAFYCGFSQNSPRAGLAQIRQLF